MSNPFYQPKVIYQLSFYTYFKDIENFEEFFADKEYVLGISTHEVDSDTIESQNHDRWVIEVLLSSKPDAASLTKELKEYSDINKLYFNGEIIVQEIEDKDWVKEYHEQLKPIIIDNFYITSKSIIEQCPPDLIPIYIEASRAFGTGDHSTTSLCIKAMNLIKNENINNIFDIGTGSGILSFAAEKIWPSAQILACDIEEVSIEIAKNNLIYNNSAVNFYQNSEYDLKIPESTKKSFDLIISNILAPVLISLSHTSKTLINNGGYIILSGFLEYQTDEIIRTYSLHGYQLISDLEENRWKTLTFKLNNNEKVY
ncbi:MAG: methyltransferase domain-containing protein [Rickettsiales bacterium]|nr:MAG: methyltransferase domain-containing protein [Rickettsiales bacterium]